MRYVEAVAKDRAYFTIDNVIDYWRGANRGELPNIPDQRAWGLVMRHAGRLRVAIPTGSFVPSRNPNCHATPRRIWRGQPMLMAV
jgi:hypothetical protein